MKVIKTEIGDDIKLGNDVMKAAKKQPLSQGLRTTVSFSTLSMQPAVSTVEYKDLWTV